MGGTPAGDDLNPLKIIAVKFLVAYVSTVLIEYFVCRNEKGRAMGSRLDLLSSERVVRVQRTICLNGTHQ